MSRTKSRAARAVAFTVVAGLLAGCGGGFLPRSGPNKSEIYAGSVLREGDAFIVSVNPRVTAATAVLPALGFSSAFQNANPIGPDTIRPGDTLGLIIYENVEDGLLTNAGASASLIDEVQVDAGGFIFVPYAGRIRAAGNTPEALRRVITARLDEQTPDPQVLVRRLAGDGATVTVVGAAAAQGVYPIERPTRTLTSMIAAAGGVAIDPTVAKVSVSRGQRTESIFFSDLFRNPRLDIALRDGDRVYIEDDTRAFTVLGATGAQNRLEFETETLSAIEALAQVGGLNPSLATPTGVFVFRNEAEAIAEAVMGRDDLQGTQRLVYVLDLTEPNGMFDARDFLIRDGDTVYVTEAPIVAFNRTVSAVFGTLGNATGAANSVATLAGN
ncbi:polysaccharide biosynthesis/export family protein [Jannaschia sp. W003]|uniref:polysaccharide biosynthesis/export family protein n=1 Tax=Jannaschia sp. W003 TaxID=2867012 RepID=UPI0021A7D9E0|nr:polysaccharide biosynthesis/export family protein [Jannaschia sp. W003]UWQ20060.1 polysaccharide biosynthesis/export family protein [Jannaschia sp. W003]